MKYALLFFSLLLHAVSYGQDTIVQKNGSPIVSKVLEIDKHDVRYKKFENLEGPSYVISKSDISMIRYQNGSTDTFNVASLMQRTKAVRTPLSEMYFKGHRDAGIHYTRYKPAATWTLALTIPLNAFGIIPAVAFSATPPAKANLGYPDEILLQDPDYLKGYVAGAKNKKAKYVMKNFAIGAVGSFVLGATLILLANSR
jgi:hypothetical protein